MTENGPRRGLAEAVLSHAFGFLLFISKTHMNAPALTEKEFSLYKKLIYDIAGIHLSEAKKALVSGRLAKRLMHYGLPSYAAYFDFLKTDAGGELQTAVDLLTTNETFFFRESRHFDFLRDHVLTEWKTSEARRLWSAASSSGEEAYTLAMVLAEHSPTGNWKIVGTDISKRMLARASAARYRMERAKHIPERYLHKYCLRGVGRQEGSFLVGRALRDKVDFVHANLQRDVTSLGAFDVILLRNVLIYFDLKTKRNVVSNAIGRLRPGGVLLVGSSETLNGVTDRVVGIAPSIYRKPL